MGLRLPQKLQGQRLANGLELKTRRGACPAGDNDAHGLQQPSHAVPIVKKNRKPEKIRRAHSTCEMACLAPGIRLSCTQKWFLLFPPGKPSARLKVSFACSEIYFSFACEPVVRRLTFAHSSTDNGAQRDAHNKHDQCRATCDAKGAYACSLWGFPLGIFSGALLRGSPLGLSCGTLLWGWASPPLLSCEALVWGLPCNGPSDA